MTLLHPSHSTSSHSRAWEPCMLSSHTHLHAYPCRPSSIPLTIFSPTTPHPSYPLNLSCLCPCFHYAHHIPTTLIFSLIPLMHPLVLPIFLHSILFTICSQHLYHAYVPLVLHHTHFSHSLSFHSLQTHKTLSFCYPSSFTSKPPKARLPWRGSDNGNIFRLLQARRSRIPLHRVARGGDSLAEGDTQVENQLCWRLKVGLGHLGLWTWALFLFNGLGL